MIDLVTADLQLSEHPRDSYRWGIFERLRALIRRYSADRLLILGDLTEKKDQHAAILVNRTVDEIIKTTKLCQVIMLRGNHDYLSDPSSPFFAFIQLMNDRFIWINEPKQIGRDLFLPHTTRYKEDWKGLWTRSSKYRFIFAHNTFSGAGIGNRITAAGILPGVFPPRQRIISGDIHIPQSFGCITYVGAPHLVDFGDDFQPHVLKLDDDRVSQIRLHGPGKRLIELASPYKLDGMANSGDIVKVRVKITAGDYVRWQEIVDSIRQSGEEGGLLVHAILPVMEQTKILPIRVVSPVTDEQLLQNYGRQRGIDEHTMKVGVELL